MTKISSKIKKKKTLEKYRKFTMFTIRKFPFGLTEIFLKNTEVKSFILSESLDVVAASDEFK